MAMLPLMLEHGSLKGIIILIDGLSFWFDAYRESHIRDEELQTVRSCSPPKAEES